MPAKAATAPCFAKATQDLAPHLHIYVRAAGRDPVRSKGPLAPMFIGIFDVPQCARKGIFDRACSPRTASANRTRLCLGDILRRHYERGQRHVFSGQALLPPRLYLFLSPLFPCLLHGQQKVVNSELPAGGLCVRSFEHAWVVRQNTRRVR